MTTFLFWNMGRQEDPCHVAALAREHSVDVILLVECVIPPAFLLGTLNAEVTGAYRYYPSKNQRFGIFAKLDPKYITNMPTISLSSRYEVRHLRIPGQIDILITLAHGPDKRSTPDLSDRELFFTNLGNAIIAAEGKVRHRRTIVVGDLNADPFENVVADARYLHGVMTKAIAKSGGRTVQKKHYPFFYNPMWRFYGDDKASPSGTYYYSKSPVYRLFWHLLDQVLVRPDLLDCFMDDDLAILDRAGGTSLVTDQGYPRKNRTPSDHLPVLFRLNLSPKGDDHGN